MPGGGLALRVEPAPEVARYIGPGVRAVAVLGGLQLTGGGRTAGTASRHRGHGVWRPGDYFLANLISQPSAFVLGRPGLGRSSLVRHIHVSVVPAWGIVPMILSDLKPDYVDVIRALDDPSDSAGSRPGIGQPPRPWPDRGVPGRFWLPRLRGELARTWRAVGSMC